MSEYWPDTPSQQTDLDAYASQVTDFQRMAPSNNSTYPPASFDSPGVAGFDTPFISAPSDSAVSLADSPPRALSPNIMLSSPPPPTISPQIFPNESFPSPTASTYDGYQPLENIGADTTSTSFTTNNHAVSPPMSPSHNAAYPSQILVLQSYQTEENATQPFAGPRVDEATNNFPPVTEHPDALTHAWQVALELHKATNNFPATEHPDHHVLVHAWKVALELHDMVEQWETVSQVTNSYPHFAEQAMLENSPPL